MKKALSIGLIVCVLAMGGIGAAFATGMDFSNVGALSAGTETIPQVNVDGITWQINHIYPGDQVVGVRLSFDKALCAGTEFNVTVLNSADEVQTTVWFITPVYVPASGYVRIPFDESTMIEVEDVDKIRVLVSEETVP